MISLATSMPKRSKALHHLRAGTWPQPRMCRLSLNVWMKARLTDLLIARWGLVPSWAKDIKIGSKLINARSETILEKPSFRNAAVKRRAILPAEGYYEWQKTEDGKKIPKYLFSEQEPLLGFAGLYEFWPDPELPEDDPERWLLTCTVLTTTTQDALGHVHDRSPVIVPRDRFAEGLDPDLTDKADVQHLLNSLPEPTLTPRIVSLRVNSVRNNGPELIEPAPAASGD